jgi:hypothetical protein
MAEQGIVMKLPMGPSWTREGSVFQEAATAMVTEVLVVVAADALLTMPHMDLPFNLQ